MAETNSRVCDQSNAANAECLNCRESDYEIFRKDIIIDGVFRFHCRCKKCNQLFVYHNVDLDSRIGSKNI